MEEQRPRTRLNTEGGGIIVDNTPKYSTAILPKEETPERDPRYRVSSWTLGRIELLAKARFEIKQMARDDLGKWKSRSEVVYQSIAQSVRASSAIEAEEVYVQDADIPPFPTASKNDDPTVSSEEIDRRYRSGKDIYDAYIWALNMPANERFTLDFITDLHKRMFSGSLGDKAGAIRNENLTISGGGYRVETVPWRQVKPLLNRFIDRLDFQWNLANSGRFSHFLLAGEFVVDYLAIHPFEDGNGRMARLLSTVFLEKAGYHFPRFYPLDYIIRERHSEYYKALFDAQCNWMTADEDLTPWMEFYVESVELQFKRSLDYLRKQHLEEQTRPKKI